VRRLAAPTEASPWDATELTVSAGSLGQLVAVVCGAGADAVVIEPSEVVEAVRAALQAVLDAS
jgi:predicted DNA-binding transcriptional regulator YafY